MEGRDVIALVAGSLLGFFGWKALKENPEESTMPNDQSEAMEERAPKTLNMAILRGRMDPDGARRTLREAIDEGDPEEDRAAVDEMKHFLHENPIRL